MTKDKDRIAERLKAISSAKPIVIHATETPPRKKGRPQRAARETVFRPGKIDIEKNKSCACVIRDITENGAHISMESIISLPPIVVLHSLQLGRPRKARVAWQDATETGLEFID